MANKIKINKKALKSKVELIKRKLNIKIMERQLHKAVKLATIEAHAEVVRGVAKKSSGARETRYNPRRNVVVSRPGGTPNIDFGTFIKSIQFEVKKRSGFVGTNDERGPWFEFGTKNMKARPWLNRGVKRARRKMKLIFRKIKIKPFGRAA